MIIHSISRNSHSNDSLKIAFSLFKRKIYTHFHNIAIELSINEYQKNTFIKKKTKRLLVVQALVQLCLGVIVNDMFFFLRTQNLQTNRARDDENRAPIGAGEPPHYTHVGLPKTSNERSEPRASLIAIERCSTPKNGCSQELNSK